MSAVLLSEPHSSISSNIGRCELYKGGPKHDYMPVVIPKPGLSTAAPNHLSFRINRS